MNRRHVLRDIATAGAGIYWLSTRNSQAHDEPPKPAELPGATAPGDIRARHIEAEFTQIATNVFAFVQHEARGESNYSISNAGIIVGQRDLLAIDSTAAPVHAGKLRVAAERATKKPIRRVIYTHHHGDHTLGAQTWGEVESIAHEACRALMLTQVSQPKPPLWNPAPAWATGKETFHRPLPDITYSQQLTLHQYGAAGTQLIHPGKAHTDGDTWVYLPQEKVAFIGDLGFFGVTPLNGSGYIQGWLQACDHILSVDVNVIVPGHGPIGGKSELRLMRDYLALLYQGTLKARNAGLSPGRAAASIDLGVYATWPDAERIVNNVVRLYRELDGTITPEPVDPAQIQRARDEYNAARQAPRG